MENFEFIQQNKTTRLPRSSGVYSFKEKKGKFLYIGKAANIKERVRQHLGGSRMALKKKSIVIGSIKTDSEIESLVLEAELIKKYQPKYNVLWKDDKNYFYVAFTKDKFPKVFVTHQIKKDYHAKDPVSKFIGPFIDGTSLKKTLTYLRKAFPYYASKSHPKKKCLWCQLNLCPGPNPDPKEYKKNIENLIKVLRGEKSNVFLKLKKEMIKASQKQNFEKAAKLKNQAIALEKILQHAKIFTNQPEKEEALEELEKLKKILKMEKRPKRIEAFDVSNIQGQIATGSMVVFVKGKPDKSQYRKFKVRLPGKPNDTAMLKEVISRRLKHKEWPLPDLILVDGGKAQLNAAISLKHKISKKTKITALAKRKNELFVENKKTPLLLEDLPGEVANLILRLRDEAHRFALTYHKKLREIDLKKNI